MTLEELKNKYDKLQSKYGAKELDSIYYGGCTDNADICFVFMNPTGRNIASSKEWKGIKAPWIGTKNIWSLFKKLNLITEETYEEISKIKGSEWTTEFAEKVYKDITNHKVYITNLGKCTQLDARPLPDSVFLEYLKLVEREFVIVKPKVIILFGNQVSSIVLNQKVSVSTCRKEAFTRKIAKQEFKFYPVYYPVGNGFMNVEKAIEDIKWIMEKELNKYSE